MTPEEALRKAERARQIFNDPMVRETLDLMEREVTEAWLTCPVRDAEARETLWRMAVTTRKFRDLLRGTMESGKIAIAQIQQKKTLLERGINSLRSA